MSTRIMARQTWFLSMATSAQSDFLMKHLPGVVIFGESITSIIVGKNPAVGVIAVSAAVAISK